MKHLQQPRMPMVNADRFAMVPRSDVPRSTFATVHTYKTTFDFDYLVPVHVDEVLPGDVHQGDMTVFARVSNLLFPLMDNLEVESFFFFVPSRIVWTNWVKMMGQQDNPGDSIAFTIPQIVSPVGGFTAGSVYDYMGLPTAGQVGAAATVSINALPLRGYNSIYNQWFRDENLVTSVPQAVNDGPDSNANYVLLKRAKKHDYFTAALPWPLKGGVEVPLPITGQALVKTSATDTFTGAQNPLRLLGQTGSLPTVNALVTTNAGSNRQNIYAGATGQSPTGDAYYPSNLYADLTTATGATINAIRLAVATQQFLEKDARGGTRYTELLKNHFGVTPEDARLQRPEYIGGGRSPIQTQAIPQTSATKITGSDTAIGSLTGQATIQANHRFSYHATEHGYIIGLINVTGEVTYQQGLHRMWTRQTRYDFYWPVFANLGEQAVRNDEIFCVGTGGTDTATFGYQERWAEYRYRQSKITGLFKSTTTLNIDEWHLSQQFGALPTLNSTFITQSTPGTRVLAAGAQANGMQVLFDSVFHIRCTRPIPTYSVPGLTRF
ncbi:MAG: major capsid protein [Microvirus sp.]|nr:MAG: major capsid protein [Microvirus sp.]